MNLGTLTGNRTLRIAVVVVGISLVAALAAIFVFKVAPGTVLSFGLIGFMLFSHLFMHGGHGGHGDNEDHSKHTQPIDQMTVAGSKTDQTTKPTEHAGCH